MTASLPVKLVDISHHQQYAIDYPAAQRAGVQGVYHKATEGDTYRDPDYARRRLEADRAGVPFGAYHFARPEVGDAKREARRFLAVARPAKGDLFPALDLETTEGLTLEQLAVWGRTFYAEVVRLLEQEGLTAREGLVYGPFMGTGSVPWRRWVPRYNNDNRPPVGEWDIWQFSNGVYGRPNRVAGFPGPTDLNTFADGFKLGSIRLRADRPTKARRKTRTLKVAHASMQYGDTNAQHTHDADTILGRGYDWITGTEAGPGSGNLPAALRKAGREHGYRVFIPKRPTDCWVAVSKELIAGRPWKRMRTGYIPVIEGSSASGDPHRYGPKGVVWAKFPTDELGDIAVASAHHLTKGRFPGNEKRTRPNDPVDHYGENRALSLALGDWAKRAGKGKALAFVGADTNMVDRTSDVFFGAPLTTAWDELERYENTGHGNIDVIASYDRDGRVRAKSVRALDDRELFLHTDHFLVEARYEVELLGQD